jgi:hypothetical protein
MAQTVCIVLSPSDRERLLAIASDRNRQRKHVERAQIVLASAEHRADVRSDVEYSHKRRLIHYSQ